jgi:hypothetical protein
VRTKFASFVVRWRMWPGSGSGDVGGELGLVFGLGELVAEAGGFVAIFLRLLAVSWRGEKPRSESSIADNLRYNLAHLPAKSGSSI